MSVYKYLSKVINKDKNNFHEDCFSIFTDDFHQSFY